jgi:hypothetical protein
MAKVPWRGESDVAWQKSAMAKVAWHGKSAMAKVMWHTATIDIIKTYGSSLLEFAYGKYSYA